MRIPTPLHMILIALIATLYVSGAVAIARSAAPPTVTAVTPAPIVASGTAQVLRVTGAGFATGLVVELTVNGITETFSGAAIQGQRASSFDISVVIAHPGAGSLVVRNVDGGVSAPFAVTVIPHRTERPDPAPQPTPVIDRAEPDKATRSTIAIPLILYGRLFATGLVVTMTDPTGTVTAIEGTSIESVTPTAVRIQVVLDVTGEYTFAVTNPKGTPSNAVTVMVT